MVERVTLVSNNTKRRTIVVCGKDDKIQPAPWQNMPLSTQSSRTPL